MCGYFISDGKGGTALAKLLTGEGKLGGGLNTAKDKLAFMVS